LLFGAFCGFLIDTANLFTFFSIISTVVRNLAAISRAVAPLAAIDELALHLVAESADALADHHFFTFSPISTRRRMGGVWPKLINREETLRFLVNRFDCASPPPFNLWGWEMIMLSAVVGALIVLSIGILVAHAMDIFRSN
jgi:hypothetical protein